MKKVWAVIKREYLERVRTKAFIISTLLAPILFLALIVTPSLLMMRRGTEERRIAVVDPTGRLAAALERTLSPKSQRTQGRYRIIPFPASASDPVSLKQSLRVKILANELDGYVWIAPDIATSGQAEYYARNVSDFVEVRQISTALTTAVVEQRLGERGLDPSEVNHLIEPVKLKTVRVSKEGEREDRGATFILAYIMVMMLYLTFALYGLSVMRSIVDEKTTRIIELLLASLRPSELMAGKILGVGAVGLTQYLIWSVMGAAITAFAAAQASVLGISPGQILVLSPSILFYFVVFFLLGYFLYATMYAALGAMVNSEQEAQHLQVFIFPFLIVPLLMMPLVLRAPSGDIAVLFSLIPFFTPILMFLRITILPPPGYQILLSIVLLLLANLAVLWLAARIYRVGILMYGKRPSILELVKWIRYR